MNRAFALAAGVLLFLGALASAQTVWVYPGQYAGSSSTYFYDVTYPGYYYGGFYPAVYTPGIYPGYVGVPWGYCGDGVCNYWEDYSSCPLDCIVGASPYVYTTYATGSFGGARCSDGTGYGACSYNKPYYCNNGALIQNPAVCGCPAGSITGANNTCISVCSDGTPSGLCSPSQPFQCVGGALVQNPVTCGCPAGTAQSGGTCVGIKPACTASANPNPANALTPSVVTVNFFELATPPSSAQVDCGNGQVATASCTFSATSPYSGTCTTTCTYAEQPGYPYNSLVKANIASLSCSSVNVRVLPPIPTTGSLLTKATSCETGAVLAGAKANVYQGSTLLLTNVYADSNGELALTKLPPGTYTVEVNGADKGLATASVSAAVEASKTRVLSVCVERAFCDVKLELVKAPSSFSPAAPEAIQVRLTNRANASRTTTLSVAGSLVPLDFVAVQGLAASEQRLVTLNPNPSQDLVGSSTAMISANTNGCTQFLEVPLSVSGGLTLEATETSKGAFAGSKACYKLFVRNRGKGEGTVTLTATAPFETSFDTPSFFLGREEMRQVKACVGVPAGAAASNTSVSFKAASAQINDATLQAYVLVPGPAFQAPADCLEAARANGTLIAPFEVKNNALGGDYVAELEPAAVQAGVSVLQPVLYNFAKGANRTLYVKLDPFVARGGEQRFNAALKRLEDSLVVAQLPVCVRIQGVRGVSAQLSANLLEMKAGEGKLVRYQVKNEGNTEELFLMAANTSFQGLTMNPSSFRLAPGATQHVEVFLTPSVNTPAGLHKVILEVHAGQVKRENLLRSDTLEVLIKPNPTVAPGTVPLAMDVATPSVTFTRNSNGTTVTAVFTVTSKESVPVRVVPSIEGLPAGWSYSFEPTGAVLVTGEVANFTAHITLKNFETKDYEGTFVLTSGSAQAKAPFVIPAGSASPLSGFFTLGSVENLALLVLIAMAAAAGYFYYRSRELEEGAQQPPANAPAPSDGAAPAEATPN